MLNGYGLESENAWGPCGVHEGFSERGTNGTQLQLVRSCTLPLNLGVPDFEFKVQMYSGCPL